MCTARALALDWPFAGRRGRSLILGGHSNGGHGSFEAARKLSASDSDPIRTAFDVDALIGLAPRYADDPGESFSPGRAPPFLSIQGSVDNDVAGGALCNYEQVGQETSVGAQSARAKVAVWAYNVAHNAFLAEDGFVEGTHPSTIDNRGKAHALARAYVVPFLRRYVLGELSDTESVLRGEELPPGLEEPTWWGQSPVNPQADPLVLVSFASDELVDGVRVWVDTFTRTNDALPLSASSEGLGMSSSVDSLDVRFGQVDELTTKSRASGFHLTDALRVDWEEGGEGWIGWDVSTLQLSDAEWFSFRVANVLDVSDGDGECVRGSQPNFDFDFSVRLIAGIEDDARLVSEFALLPPQDYLWASSGVDAACWHAQFLQTVRVPLSSFCSSFSPDELTRVELRFGGSAGSQRGAVLLDSLEFVRGEPVCPI